MAEDFLSRIKSKFSSRKPEPAEDPPDDPPDEPDNDGPEPIGPLIEQAQHHPEPEPRGPALRESLGELVEMVGRTTELLEVQSKRQQQLTSALQAMPEAMDEQAHVARRHAESADALLSNLRAHDKTLEHLAGSIATLTEKLSGAERAWTTSAEGVDRLNRVLEEFARNNSAHIELMEQLRDRLVGTNEQLHTLLAAQDRRLRWMFIASMTVAGVVIAAALILRMWG